MYPNAEVPVYQLSLPQQASLADHVQGAEAFDWARVFMAHCQELIASQRCLHAHWVDRLPGLT